ncbi:MAG: transglycosylase SLT domain-containing protein [Bdellovibrionota bacterium]
MPSLNPLNWFKEKGKTDTGRFDSLIRKYAVRPDFQPHYLKGMMHVESAFDPEVKGKADEIGLMQFLPSTARSMGLAPESLKDPETAIKAGTKYLAQILDGIIKPNVSAPLHPVLKVKLAQFGYNAGPTFLKELLRRFGGSKEKMSAPENFDGMVDSLKDFPLTDKFEKIIPNFLNGRKNVVSKYQYWASRYAKDFGFSPYEEKTSTPSNASVLPIAAAGTLGLALVGIYLRRK